MNGRPDDAIRQIRIAEQLDPLSVGVIQSLIEVFYYSKQYDAVIAQAKKSYELEPGSYAATFFLEEAYEGKGLYKEAMEAELTHLAQSGDAGADKLRKAQENGGWKAYWNAKVKMKTEEASRGYYEPYLIAVMYVRLNEKNQAFAWLEKAYKSRSSWMPTVKYDAILDPLRSDPRFQQLQNRIRSN